MIFVIFLAQTQFPEQVKELIEQTKQLSAEVGGEMLNTRKTLLSQVRREGRSEGEKKGKLEEKIEMVERFLKAGAPWEMVINATGITQEKLQELKASLQEMMAGQTQLARSRLS